MSLRKVPDGPLREGFTTGTSATAAAKSALLALFTQQHQSKVRVQLPIDRVLEIPIHTCQFDKQYAQCSVIKDAGDDPDVTNGAEIRCQVVLTQNRSIRFIGGEGVGTVTLPGLELGVGEPAINPVPRQMIRNALNKLLHDYDMECGVAVTVSVENGRALAKRTLNERVGIVDGISILGTTGIVKPYSSASYIASITQGIDVAIANGITELVINSGGRSEKYLRGLFPDFPEQAFVHYGNWIGETLKKIGTEPIQKVSIGMMLGKAVKLAKGHTDTHSCVSSWDKSFVANLAQACGYTSSQVYAIEQLNMAGRLTELFPFTDEEPIYQQLMQCCIQHIQPLVFDTTIELYLVGKEGQIIKYQQA